MLDEPPRVYRRVKLSKDDLYDTEETHPVVKELERKAFIKIKRQSVGPQ
ncbi:MAG TPA: hypothetical protein VMX97_13245 [Hyphomicrobiaceae bacterium]|nr:hypothetical protein [Hyphomicrobiaceae bacterium]